MDEIVSAHFARLSMAVLKKHTAASIAKWITENTTYAGQPYSYQDHEFQERILSDTSKDVAIRKCSQVGLSESAARMALALVNVLNPYTVAYTLPTAGFAATFTKTRINPVINGSKVMSGNISKSNDNVDVKQFGDSFLFLKGAASSNAPISIPVDHLIHDEVDFSDQEVLGQYVSRLTHSKWRRTTLLSTPTLPGFGIDKAFKESRRWFNMVKCNHCNNYFVPNYYDHVHVPGYTKDLRDIRPQVLLRIRWREATLNCPKCGKEPSLQVEHRKWVCENPSDPYVRAGYQVAPFDAPNIISPSYLVEASTKYDRLQDFVNFNLGLPMDDSEATMTRKDFDGLFVNMELPGSVQFVMGVDVGNIYHFAVAAVDPWGDMIVVHTEQVPMGNAKNRYRELRNQFHVICTVIDSGPHAETVMSLQDEDPNLFASIYMRSKSMVTHNVVEKKEDATKGQDFVRQVNVNRNRAFDAYMEMVRNNHMRIVNSEESEAIIQHHTSMKRVKVFDNDSGEMQFSWQKSDGIDHYHHTFLYCWLASKIRGVGQSSVLMPLGMIGKFRLKGNLIPE